MENGGLRCIYHGWLMSGTGRCLEQPGEPANSTFKDKIRHTAYPCVEAGGLILTYMGPGEPPRLPQYPFFSCDPEQVWTTKIYHECNYLQAERGQSSIRSISRSCMSAGRRRIRCCRIERPADRGCGAEARCAGNPVRLSHFRNATHRSGSQSARITNFIMPNCSAFDGVPIINPASPDYANIYSNCSWPCVDR